MIDPDFIQSNEQAGPRPALVVSDDRMNHGNAGLSIVVPITSRVRDIASHICVKTPEGGLSSNSDLMCEQLRALSQSRFRRRLGSVEPATLEKVEKVLIRLLALTGSVA